MFYNDDTYYQDFIDGEYKEVTKSSDSSGFIPHNSSNVDSIINGINALFLNVCEQLVHDKLDSKLIEIFNSEELKSTIVNKVVNSIQNEANNQIPILVNDYFIENQIYNIIEKMLSDAIGRKIDSVLDKFSIPNVYQICINGNVTQTKPGYFHEKFSDVLTDIELDDPVMLIGPAGSGKNHMVSQIADALDLPMYYTNNASNEFKLTGFIDAGGNYRETEFYKAFKNGGIFFLDEIDNSDPSAIIVINSALANGYMAFPHETIDRHPKFRMVAAANTWGKGADLEYVGRNALDASTLDRYEDEYIDYDRKLEKALYPNEEVLEFMWSFRDAVSKSKIPHIVSTRGIGKVFKSENHDISVEKILRKSVIKNLGQDDINMIVGNMENINESNKYYEGIKQLRLMR